MLKRPCALVARCLLALAAALPLAAAAAPQLMVPFQGPVQKTQKAKPFKSEGSRIKFNVAELRNLLPGQEAELTLPDGSKHAIVLDLVQDKGNGITSWVGHYAGVTPALRTIITTGPGGTFGRIATPDNEYSIMPGPGDGADWLVDMKAEKPFLPPTDLKRDAHTPKLPANKSVPQSMAPPQTMDMVPGVTSPVVAQSAAAIATPSPQVVVDILMVYTSGMATSLASYTGNANAIQTRLAQLITSANTIFADSGVAVTLRMVGSQQVNYSDTARDTLGALADITPGVNLDPTDPEYDSYGVASVFANIENLRAQVGADMVTLLRDGYTNGGDGVAWVPTSAVSSTWAPYMYSAMTGCTMSCDWVWVHEVGHNFGSAHDRATNAWENNGANVPGSFPYSYGYYSCSGGSLALTCNPFNGSCTTAGTEPDCNSSASNTNNFSDIMAYFQPSTTKNIVFSNPALLTCKGVTGPASACGSNQGNPDQADAASTLNNNRVAMSQIKATVVPLVLPTTTALASSANPSLVGQPVTFTATVTASSGTPAGTVTFNDGSLAIAGCSGIALASGSATCSTAALSAVAHSITAVYSGSSAYSASTSAALAQTVAAKVTPSVRLASTGDYVPTGTSVTLTASIAGVNGVAATGSVTFTDTTTGTTLCAAVAVASNAAACPAPLLAMGDHAITATYSGNTNYNAASASLLQTMLNTARAGTFDVALAASGASALASSQYSGGYPAAGAIDGDRKGLNWTNGGGWADGTINVFPDWIQVNFGVSRSIDSVAVYTVQDNWQSPVEPTDTMTFTQFGVQDFTVQGWNGSQWVTLATVTGNNLVKRRVAFAPYTTDRIRINVTRAANSLSRITEIEAFGIATTSQVQSNVALASSGAVASASSVYNAGFGPAGAIDGDHKGLNWTNGGGWADGTLDTYPDWLQVDFAGSATIDHVIVYTVQDNWQAPVEPTDTMTFTYWGVRDFTVQGWNGTSWVTLGTVTGNNLVKRTVNFAPFTTSHIRVNVTNASSSLSRITELEAWGTMSAPVSNTNFAAASAGAVATASSSFGPAYPVSSIINGERAGWNWSAGGGWADATLDSWPDWVQVNFNGTKTINTVTVYTLQDNWQNPVEPTDIMTFTQYGIRDFSVQGWDGTQWVTLASVTGNNMVKRALSFTPFTTDRIRINVTNSAGDLSRITEVEAWGPGTAPTGPSGTNVALASNGSVASASSRFSASYPASATIDGDRKGTNWSAGGGWADGTIEQYPDWLEVDFSGAKTLNTINVYTLQDNWQSPVEPTDAMTFTQYGIRDFTVQSWDGTQWQTLATVTGNTLVKRSFPVSVTTTKIRVNVTAALNSLARITEVEAWGN
jgi:hypothetical protein